MKRKRTLADLVPPGAKFKRDLGLLALWFALFVLLGSFLIFVIRYENARSRLYEDVLGRRLLRSGAQIDSLATILGGTFRLAVVYGILTFVNIAANYMTFYRESKSIYLMRRIHDRHHVDPQTDRRKQRDRHGNELTFFHNFPPLQFWRGAGRAANASRRRSSSAHWTAAFPASAAQGAA